MFNGYEVSVRKDEKFSGDWFHNSMDVLNTI